MSIKNILRKLNSRETLILPNVNTLTKIIFITLITITATFFVKNILAAVDSEAIEAFKTKQAAAEIGNNQESWMSEAASSNSMTLVNALVGKIPDNVLDQTNTETWIPGGMIGAANKTIASLYNPPASGVQYIAQSVNNFLGKPVYAANNGYQGLSALIPIWKGFRNATYTIFSLVFIITGIMIMLRVKINPQTVLTIQNIIPGLITSLILITFSYAIAGLLIDISYVVEGLAVSIILKAGKSSETITHVLQNPDVFARISDLLPLGVITLFSLIISGAISLVAGIITSGPGAILGVFALAIIFIVLGIILLWYTLKFFIGLTKCYVNIILKIIIAPLEIAFGAIPNMKIGFGSWFINILANILVFPISIAFLVLLNILIETTKGQNLWMPPGIDSLNWWTGASGGILPVAFGLGGLMIVSKLPSMIPEFIFQIKPSPWGKAIGEGFAPYSKFVEKQAKTAGADIKNKWMDSRESNTTPGTFDTTKGGKNQKMIWNILHSRDKHH